MTDPLVFVALGLLVLGVAWFAGTYNGLVRLRNHTNESWSGIDTELKRRYDLILNLVATVKGYADHERTLLERIASARGLAAASTGSPASQAVDENRLVRTLRELFAVVEGYPQLKADKHFVELQHELASTEDRIQAARRFYNANVRDFNNRIEAFPSHLVAGLFNFRQREFFEIEAAHVRAAPEVRL